MRNFSKHYTLDKELTFSAPDALPRGIGLFMTALWDVRYEC
jgi:hypothetical protein